MSHEVENAFFVGQPAWHGLGTLLEQAPSFQDAIKLAGLDWQVKQAPVQFTRPLQGVLLPQDAPSLDLDALASFPSQEIGEETTTVDSHFVNYRETDGAVLGVVGKSYHPYQNSDVFSWFQPLVDKGLVTLEAAGSLQKGRKVWVLAKVNDSVIEVLPGDEVTTYALFANGHDGKFAIRAGFTDTRVVCMNTLRAAVHFAERLFKVRHSANAVLNLEAAREVLDFQRQALRVRAEIFQAMAKHNLSDKQATNYIRECLSEGAGTNEEIEVRNVPEIFALYETGRGAEFGRGTLWNAFNAVTEYLTHSRHRSLDTRLDSQWFGNSAKLAGRALTIAETLLRKG